MAQHGINLMGRQAKNLRYACNYADISMVRKFLPNWSQDMLEYAPPRRLTEAMETSSVEAFEMLRRIKEKTDPVSNSGQLGGFLDSACLFAWEDMAAHIISQGAEVHEEEGDDGFEHLCSACEGGSELIVRLLLQHGANIQDDALGTAAKYGHWHLVWILIDEYGVNPNIGDDPPIIWAIKDKRETDIQTLLNRGAKLDGVIGVKAVEMAQAEELQSMLAWLEEHGVDIAKIRTEQKGTS